MELLFDVVFFLSEKSSAKTFTKVTRIPVKYDERHCVPLPPSERVWAVLAKPNPRFLPLEGVLVWGDCRDCGCAKPRGKYPSVHTSVRLVVGGENLWPHHVLGREINLGTDGNIALGARRVIATNGLSRPHVPPVNMFAAVFAHAGDDHSVHKHRVLPCASDGASGHTNGRQVASLTLASGAC